jgi:hypothetical protein
VTTALVCAAEDLHERLARTALGRTDVRLIACTPETLMPTARAEQPALAVLDGRLPDTLGLVTAVRSDPATRNLSVVVWIPEETTDTLALRAAGVNAVLTDRLEPSLWDDRLEALLAVPRRREVRTPVSLRVISRASGAAPSVEGTALNLSSHGLLLETAAPLDRGQILDLGLTLPDGDPEELHLVGRVVWSAPAGGMSRCGVQFLGFHGGALGRITPFVAAAG